MGQQQVLLVVLVIILLAISAVVSLNVFGATYKESNSQAMRQDMLQGLSSAQALYFNSKLLGGANRNFETGFDGDNDMLGKLNMAVLFGFENCLENEYGNENGCYSISDRTENGFIITGSPRSGGSDISMSMNFNFSEMRWIVNVIENE